MLPNLKGDVEVTADRSGIKRLSAGYKNEKREGVRDSALGNKVEYAFCIDEWLKWKVPI